jgi:hypothetical protein
MSQAMHSRSTSGLSEHSSLDSSSGSIGITRRGKYTDVPRSRASGRARRRRARSATTSAIATTADSRAVGSQYTASSKSFAVSPSMVTSGSA